MDNLLVGFKNFMRIDKGLSENTIEAYLDDVSVLSNYFNDSEKFPLKVTVEDIPDFLRYLSETENLNESSQARRLSGIRAFYKYLLYEDLLPHSPFDLIESPKLARKLP